MYVRRPTVRHVHLYGSASAGSYYFLCWLQLCCNKNPKHVERNKMFDKVVNMNIPGLEYKIICAFGVQHNMLEKLSVAFSVMGDKP